MRSMVPCYILLFFLLACGRDNDSSGKKIVPIAPERMEDILNQQTFTCQSQSGTDCPFGIGRLFIINPEDTASSAVCTGFLISGNRMITNHHCVSSQKACNTTFISIHTPAGPVKSRCRNVVFTEANSDVATERSVDLTVMEIDPVLSTPVFAVSGTRTSPGKEVTAWVVDHLDLLKSNITELTCEFEDKKASMILQNCPAISGNSGSPVVLKNSHIAIGILWGSNLPPTVDASFPLEMRFDLKALSLATELYPLRSVISDEASSLRSLE